MGIDVLIIYGDPMQPDLALLDIKQFLLLLHCISGYRTFVNVCTSLWVMISSRLTPASAHICGQDKAPSASLVAAP